MKSIDEIAFGIFGAYFKTKREFRWFVSLRENLIKARIFVSIERWLSKAVFYSVIGSCVLLSIYLSMKFLLSLLPKLDLSFSFGLTDFIILTTGSVIAFCSVFCGFYFLPNMKAWERERKIEELLPYAISYISSMAAIGMIPYEIFKKLSEEGENYGEVSVEARQIVRDVSFFGYDFMTALKNLASTTPSANMRTFLQGAVTTALSGGEMGVYFINTAKIYMAERRKNYENFINTLGIIAEFYVTGLVVGPLLLIVVFAIMCFMGSGSLSTLAAIVYLVIPLSTAAFVFLLDVMFSAVHK